MIAVFLFGFVVFAHELGHFLAARWAGVKVNEFAIGMGPTIFKFVKGETKYSLRLLPVGGFCAMEGEDSESDDQSSFSKKPVVKRMVIVVAGVFMNMVTGFLLIMIVLAQQTKFASTTIESFSENAVSNQSGLQVGDQIKKINGYGIVTHRDFIFAIATDSDSSVDMIVQRDQNDVELSGVNFSSGIDFKVSGIEKNFFTLISQSFNECVSTIRVGIASLAGLVSGKFKFSDMAGPVGTVSAISQAAAIGLEVSFISAVNNILLMMMMLSISLGVFNILPFPALDGGRLVFLIIEAIRGKPVNPKYEQYVNIAGFALLILLMITVTFSDVFKLITGNGFGS